MSEYGYGVFDLPDPKLFGEMAHVANPKRSEDLRTRSPFGTLDYYMREQEAVWPGRIDYIESLHNTLEPPRYKEAPRLIVAIPIAGHQEAEHIQQTLVQYKKQLLDPTLWELVLYVNAPMVDDKGVPLSMQSTLDAIEQERAAGMPNVRVMTHYYHRPEPIGTVRKDLWDTIAYDLHQRGANRDALVINNDSDTVHLRNDYLTEMAYPYITGGFDILRAPLRFGYDQDAPLASKLIRYHWHLYTAYCYQANIKPAVEANSAMTIGMYCKAGGFDPTNTLNEYNNMARRHAWLSHFYKLSIRAGNDKWVSRAPLKTSPRRQLATIARGDNLEDVWNTAVTPFGPYDSLRERTPSYAAELKARYMASVMVQNMLEEFTPSESPEIAQQIHSFSKKALAMMSLEVIQKVTE